MPTAATALAPSPVAPTTIDREQLAQRVIVGIGSIATKLSELEPDIRQLWIEFKNLPHGETIMGCATKKEFCETHLHRTPRAIQYLLNGGSNGNYVPVAERSEIISPAIEGDPELSALLAPLTPEERAALESEPAPEPFEAPAMEILPPEPDLARLRKRFTSLGLDVKKSDHGSKYLLDKLTEAQLDRIATLLVNG